MTSRDWVTAGSLSALRKKHKTVVKRKGRQILLWQVGGETIACANRCPHEGYPLAEGKMSDDCVLTCNWHNWKFDLKSGETLLGGDTLRRYPVRLDGDSILVDITDPPEEEIRGRALDGLSEAFTDHDYARIARELARFERAGGDPLDALKAAFGLARDRLEYGTTHAHAGAADWLTLRRGLNGASAADRMVPVTEIVGHLAWDSLMDHGTYPYPQGTAERFDPRALAAAIENEDEATAVPLARRGLADGLLEDLRGSLERASLQHYQDFGHSPIYCDKSFELLAMLGGDAAEDLVLPLVRSLCMGTREDLIPEFRDYAGALDAWEPDGTGAIDPAELARSGVRACFGQITRAGGRTDQLYDALMLAAADQMLHFDARFRDRIDRPVQDNVDWLDFTHAVTHLNAVRRIAGRQADLWRNGLLQTGCFLGRNVGYVDWDQPVEQWAVADADTFFDTTF
jgi:nitrite reductase/ring-hydroxylating ferredoxin subunit